MTPIKRALFIALISCLVWSNIAIAETAVAVITPENDWTPVLNNALSIVLMASATAIAGIVTAVGVKLAAKLGLQVTAQDKQNFEAEATTVLNAAIAKLLPLIETKGWDNRVVHEAILTSATNFLRERFPDRAAKLTAAAQPEDSDEPVSSTTAITDSLAGRLPAVIAVAAASPATPRIRPPT